MATTNIIIILHNHEHHQDIEYYYVLGLTALFYCYRCSYSDCNSHCQYKYQCKLECVVHYRYY